MLTSCDHDRYESFVLGPGESKVEVEIDTRKLFLLFSGIAVSCLEVSCLTVF